MNALSHNYVTYSEIISQPSAWQLTLDELKTKTPALRDLIRLSNIRNVIFTGCGTPYYLSITAAAMCRSLTDLPAEAHPSSSVWLFPELTLSRREKTLLVATSRSGETTEIVQAIQQFKSVAEGPSIAITCYDESAIVEAAAFCIIAQNAREQGLAQTRSFTSMLIAAQGLIFALAGQPLSQQFLELPAFGRALIDDHHDLAQQIGEDQSIDRFFFLGSQPYYGLACEAMLKMKEMTLGYSEAFHFMEFRHGPMAVINPHTLIVGLISEAALSHESAVLREMRTKGARTLAVTPVELDPSIADYQILLPDGLTDMERAPLYLPVLHVLTYCRTLMSGLNPDKPHSLNAVVNLDIQAIEKRGKRV